MKLRRRNFLHLAAGAAALPVVSRMAHAQAYPTRPVRIIVGFAPGGGTDVLARIIGQWLSERLGQPFLIENRTGAGSNIGAEAAIKARADGYTILMCTTTNAVNETLYDKLDFTFHRDRCGYQCRRRLPIARHRGSCRFGRLCGRGSIGGFRA